MGLGDNHLQTESHRSSVPRHLDPTRFQLCRGLSRGVALFHAGTPLRRPGTGRPLGTTPCSRIMRFSAATSTTDRRCRFQN